MKRAIREQARQLRTQGKSVRDIAKSLNVSTSSVSVWVRDIPLTETQIEELKQSQRYRPAWVKGAHTNRDYYRERRLAYQQAGRLQARENSPLHRMGCMLYWAEGAKRKTACIL